MTRVLIATAVPPEAQALASSVGDRADVAAVGVGPAASAAGAARLLALAEAAGRPYTAVVSAGIAGGFLPYADIGATVIGTRTIAADLGALTPEGFIPLTELGFGGGPRAAAAELVDALRTALPQAVVGEVLSVSTITGTAAATAALLARHPAAVAEAMEGYGIACAAADAGLPFVELRTISNAVGPRDRDAWRIGDALAALTAAGPALAALAG